MANLLPLRILLTADRSTARWRKDRWSMECPVADLPRWLAFYRCCAARHPRFYAQSVEVIEAAMRRADIRENVA